MYIIYIYIYIYIYLFVIYVYYIYIYIYIYILYIYIFVCYNYIFILYITRILYTIYKFWRKYTLTVAESGSKIFTVAEGNVGLEGHKALGTSVCRVSDQ